MIDCATPIHVDGNHIANFFTGQFFLEKPDIGYFKKQAETFGFDERAYLKAVSMVPVWSEQQLAQYLSVIKTITEILADIGYKNLKEIEERKANEKIALELTKMASNLTKREEEFHRLFEDANDCYFYYGFGKIC